MVGYMRTRVSKHPIIARYFEFENELKFYNLEAWSWAYKICLMLNSTEHKIKHAHEW